MQQYLLTCPRSHHYQKFSLHMNEEMELYM